MSSRPTTKRTPKWRSTSPATPQLLVALAAGTTFLSAPASGQDDPAARVPDVGVPASEPAATAPSARTATEEEVRVAPTKVQENKVAEAEDRIALAKSGKLLRYGVTAGAALSLQTPFTSTRGVKVNSAVATVAPYLGILPAYWTANEERAVYCSTTGLFQDGEQARRAATAISRKKAKIELELMVSWLKVAGFADLEKIDQAQITAAMTRAAGAAPYEIGDVEYLTMAAQTLAIADQAQRELKEQDVVNVLAARRWRPELASSCGWYRLGFWAGRPFGYSADVTISGQQAPRDVTPVVSFGGLYVPNSYVTVMFGTTYNTVLEPTAESATGVHRAVWTLAIGFGGTLDIATLLARD